MGEVTSIEGVIYTLYVGAVLLVLAVVYYINLRNIEVESEDFPDDYELDEYLSDIKWVPAEEEEVPVKSAKKATGGVAVKERPNTRLNAFVTLKQAPDESDVDLDEFPHGIPAFEEGDTVCVINPFTLEYVYETNDYMPLYYSVLEVKWDEQDGVFRYLISAQEEWIAEDWLEEGNMAVMAKKGTELDSEVLDGDKHGLSLKETLTIAMLTDTITRERSINHYLDLMNTGDGKDKAHATDMLARLTETGA